MLYVSDMRDVLLPGFDKAAPPLPLRRQRPPLLVNQNIQLEPIFLASVQCWLYAVISDVQTFARVWVVGDR